MKVTSDEGTRGYRLDERFARLDGYYLGDPEAAAKAAQAVAKRAG